MSEKSSAPNSETLFSMQVSIKVIAYLIIFNVFNIGLVSQLEQMPTQLSAIDPWVLGYYYVFALLAVFTLIILYRFLNSVDNTVSTEVRKLHAPFRLLLLVYATVVLFIWMLPYVMIAPVIVYGITLLQLGIKPEFLSEYSRYALIAAGGLSLAVLVPGFTEVVLIFQIFSLSLSIILSE